MTATKLHQMQTASPNAAHVSQRPLFGEPALRAALVFAITILASLQVSHANAATSKKGAQSMQEPLEVTEKSPHATPAPLDERLIQAKPGKIKKTLGWLQSIRVLPHKVRLTAKLDTGAKSSVMHAVDIKPFKKAGKNWVRFTVPEEKKKQGLVEMYFELPVVDKSRVKQHHVDELDERYVVEMNFCIAGKVYSADFSLDNRNKFNYPVLLGRDFLQSYFVVDPGSTFVAKYNCLPVSKAKK